MHWQWRHHGARLFAWLQGHDDVSVSRIGWHVMHLPESSDNVLPQLRRELFDLPVAAENRSEGRWRLVNFGVGDDGHWRRRFHVFLEDLHGAWEELLGRHDTRHDTDGCRRMYDLLKFGGAKGRDIGLGEDLPRSSCETHGAPQSCCKLLPRRRVFRLADKHRQHFLAVPQNVSHALLTRQVRLLGVGQPQKPALHPGFGQGRADF
mmetsp:Transcript_483/g.1230  ORF Transcript_483/g.1230 Transcript_483/m.1230 type:complete len:206 (-) Transcript_483:151-768(-)